AIIILSITCLFANLTGFSQSTRRQTNNYNGWLMYFGNHKLADRIGVHAEVQWRRHNGVSENQQLLLRSGLDVYLKNTSRFTVGYAFIKTHPYGEFAVINSFPEHRTWQQFLTTQSFGKINLSHRYRLEQRWIGNATTGEMTGEIGR